MEILDSLFLINDTKSLDSFLLQNGQQIFDVLFLNEYSEIQKAAPKVNNFYAINTKIIDQLEFAKRHNSSFVLLLADFLERFDYSASFNSLIRLCNRKSIYISHRLRASSLYLSGHIHYNIDYLNIYDEFLTLLDIAHKTEEDDVSLVTYTLANYFNKVVNDTYQYDVKIAFQLQEKIKSSKDSDEYYFLDHKVIDYIIRLDLNHYTESASIELQQQISKCIFDRRSQPLIESFHSGDAPSNLKDLHTGNLESQDTKTNDEYSELLSTVQSNFTSIRALSVQKSKQILNENFIRNTMGRGISILTNNEQLYLYLRDYGNMHKAKLDSVLAILTGDKLDDKDIEILDWGAGQALASMVFFDFLRSKNLKPKIKEVTLIEPSELCISRGVLHLKKYNIVENIRAIKKEIDQVLKSDVQTSSRSIKIHLFSNILDVEHFSVIKLIQLIESTQKGLNYFLCVSPYINDAKVERIDSFKRHFKNSYSSFELLASYNSTNRLDDLYWNCNNNFNGNLGRYCSHPECGCPKKWTRVIRAFEVIV